ncbi:MAG: hypothetical protein PF574_09150 [Candidatus Delongbacteria bacterium]|jgi:hypothetical protein|nr:hypothetical protein [Candidatus Delongbacteria bacterium]
MNFSNVKKYLIISLLIMSFMVFSKTKNERLDELKQDSLKVKELISSMSSEIAKDGLENLLEKLDEGKQLFQPFPVDFYSLKGIRFKFNEKKHLTIDELIDLLKGIISRSKIIRINKLHFQNGSGKVNLADNTYKELDKYPEYKDLDMLRKILETTVLNSERKSSIEWIWGKSVDGDAYFSTKLTVFDKQFTLYPDYRVFVGKNSYRDKKHWFYSLKEHSPVVAENRVVASKNIINADTTISKEVVPYVAQVNADTLVIADISENSEMVDISLVKEFTCGTESGFEYDILKDEISLSADIYKKDEERNYVSNKTKNIPLKNFVKDLLSDTQSISTIKFSKTDFIIKDDNVKKLSEEEFVEITDDVRICSERIKSFFAEAMLFPDKKRSVELITGRNKSKLSYFATIITIYDGQITVFYDYKIAASSEYRKDKESWFNRLVIIN